MLKLWRVRLVADGGGVLWSEAAGGVTTGLVDDVIVVFYCMLSVNAMYISLAFCVVHVNF